ncbi:N-acetylneuraminate synthase family protein [Roseibium sp. MMSF_3544]|uniref:N-acetylneuraminate synthase family protein n=1 Tax=unclassified Roseibium TaxID=2629323 RepID=UPI00273F2427|nr:N-acetylneuraminate synthase family protein [Roseibium sp. MMSF_3544]
MISDNRIYVIAEIGINHNGDIDKALEMIRCAKASGCNAVKFQKRTIDVVYTELELAKARDNVFGPTNGDLKRGLEFGKAEYDAIDRLAKDLEIDWLASPWDEASVDFLMQYQSRYLKIASAMVMDRDFLVHCAKTKRPLLVSTGMCDLPMIVRAVEAIEDAGGEIACLYHCTSTYPTVDEEINLLGIRTLQDTFPHLSIGFSGHESGIMPSVCAAAMGAVSIERHVTLDRSDWGSDQKASLEMDELAELVGQLRRLEVVRGDGSLKFYDDEKPIAEKLRRNDTLQAETIDFPPERATA